MKPRNIHYQHRPILRTIRTAHSELISQPAKISKWSRLSYCLLFALLILISAILPAFPAANGSSEFKLEDAQLKLLGESKKDAKSHLKYDQKEQKYLFAPPKTEYDTSQSIKSGQRDDAYSVTLPKNAKQGIVLTDAINKTDVKLIPKFATGLARQADDRIAYPLSGRSYLTYTFKDNGLKEDIIVPQFSKDTLEYEFELQLPATLEARLESDGSIGVYSADPTLFGNISFGSEEDSARIEQVRRNGVKNHRMFSIPAPIIKQTGSDEEIKTARFNLDGSKITLTATELKDLNYPIAIDPSFVVTSANDFKAGTVQENVDIDETNGRLVRGKLTGATVSSWTSEGTGMIGRSQHATVASNGYLYVIAGCVSINVVGGACDGVTGGVQKAQISNTGTLGNWSAVSASVTPRYSHSAVVSNGYIYVITGCDANCVGVGNTQRGKIRPDGDITSWVSVNSPGAYASAVSVAYKNHIYNIAGSTGGNNQSIVTMTTIRGDGTLEPWVSTTSLPAVTSAHGATVYNGYLYVGGGCSSVSACATVSSVIYYSAVDTESGALGTWATTSSFTTARRDLSMSAGNGYLYISGGADAAATSVYADTQYAAIYANGELGAFQTTGNFTNNRFAHGMTYFNNHLYLTGGRTATAFRSDSQRGTVSPAGTLGTFQPSGNFNATGVEGAAVIAVKGTLYVIGGRTAATSYLATVRRAPINPNGTLGTWVTNATSITNARYGSGVAFVVNNGQIYISGGYGTCGFLGTDGYCSDIQTATVNSDGSIGSWTVTALNTGLSSARSGHTMTVHNSKMYVIGGFDGTNYLNGVEYAAPSSTGVATDGGCGSRWCAMSAISGTRTEHTAIIAGDFLYILGGHNATTTYDTVQYARLGNLLSNNTCGTGVTWCTTTSLPAARTLAGGFYSKGYLYFTGGCTNSACGTRFNTTISAPITPTGSIGTWQSNTSFTTSRSDHGAVAYQDYVYVLGGNNGTASTNDVQYAPINNGGRSITGGWNTTGIFSLTSARADHTTVTSGNYIYVIGGCTAYSGLSCTTRLDTIQYVRVQRNGSFSADSGCGTTWCNATSLPETLSNHASFVLGNKLYVGGGITDSGTVNTFRSIDINADGTLGASWASLTSFATARSQHQMIAYNGYVYAMGGADASNVTIASNEVNSLTSDGTLGANWTAVTSLTNTVGMAVIAHNGYMYAIGGATGTSGGSGFNGSFIAVINSNGTLSSWRPGEFTGHFGNHRSALVVDGHMYFFNGLDFSSATIAPGGAYNVSGSERSIVSNTLASSHSDGGVVMVGAYMYALGGCTSYVNAIECTAPSASVEKTALQSISRKGRYSQTYDAGGNARLNKLYIEGSGEVLTRPTAAYRTATQDGLAFGNSLHISEQFLNSLFQFTSQESRFINVSYVLNDTASAIFPDSESTLGSITRSELFFTPSPAKRLKGGKTFVEEQSKGLEINPN